MERRNRPPASCEPCRGRKLKCNRDLPCDTCTKRGVECVYASNARRGPRVPSKETQLRDKLNKLEGLVSSLLGKQTEANGAQLAAIPNGPRSSSADHMTTHSTPTTTGSSVLTESPRPVADQNGLTCYVDASHWQSVLEELKEVRENLVSDELPQTAEPNVSAPSLPMLVDATNVEIEDILADLPLQPVCNALLSAYFTSSYSHLSIVHPDMFKAGYDKFWAAQDQPTDFMWLGLFFGILAIAMAIKQLAQGPDPTLPSASTLQQRTLQCLALGNYQKANTNVVETLLLHMHSRFLTDKQNHMQLWLTLGHTVQLALKLAYHRDPSRLSNCSVIEGEMRRRVWLNLRQVEAIGSFQVGLPSLIQDSSCDTGLPGNYDASDLTLGMDVLPPPRALSHRTQMTYSISKNPVMTVFKKITQHVQTLDAVTYDRTLSLDLEMRDAYSNVPPPLQRKNVDQAYMDLSAIIWDRATIEMLYLKGLIVLHRFYLRHDRRNPRFNHSRSACIEAALDILARQADLHAASLPGGRLYEESWMLSVLTVYDFILAAMVVCLDLSTRTGAGSECITLSETEQRELNALITTRNIWKSGHQYPEEVFALARTLDQVIKSTEDRRQKPVAGSAVSEQVSVYGIPPHDSNANPKTELLRDTLLTPDIYATDPMWDMIEGGGDLDWPILDQYFLGNTSTLPGTNADEDGYIARTSYIGG